MIPVYILVGGGQLQLYITQPLFLSITEVIVNITHEVSEYYAIFTLIVFWLL